MPKKLDSMWRRLYFNWSLSDEEKSGHSNFGTYGPRHSDIDRQLNDLIEELSAKGWEIKSAIPIVASRYGTSLVTNVHGMSSTWGAGWGYGAPFTEGIIVLAQRWSEITQEESDRQERERLAKEQDRLVAANEVRRKEERDKVLNMPVERRGIFEAKWQFNGEEYQSKKAAEEAREDLARSKLEGT